MVDEIDDKKKSVGGIKKPINLNEVRKSEAVKDVNKAGAVSKVGGVASGGKRPTTRVMTAAEREELMKMVEEEAEKMFGQSKIGSEQREVIEEAVKMTIDAAIVEDDNNDDDSDDEDKN